MIHILILENSCWLGNLNHFFIFHFVQKFGSKLEKKTVVASRLTCMIRISFVINSFKFLDGCGKLWLTAIHGAFPNTPWHSWSQYKLNTNQSPCWFTDYPSSIKDSLNHTQSLPNCSWIHRKWNQLVTKLINTYAISSPISPVSPQCHDQKVRKDQQWASNPTIKMPALQLPTRCPRLN